MGFLDKVKGYISKEKNPSYFLALNITDDQTEAVIWGFIDGKTEILGSSLRNYQNREDLLLVAGEVIDEAGSRAGVDVSEVIFGLPPDWVEGEKIISPYSENLRRLAKDLDLEPLAFVTNLQAIIHFVSHQDLSSPSAIFVEVNRKKTYLSLVANGKILETKVAPYYEGDFIKFAKESLSNFKSEKPYSSRFILYGTGDLEKIRGEIEKFDWNRAGEEVQIFLHLPKVDVLPKGLMGKAVALAGATDLGFEKPRFEITPEESKLKVAQPATIGETGENKIPFENEAGDNFGFIYGHDVLKDQPKENKLEVETETIPPQEDFGPRSENENIGADEKIYIPNQELSEVEREAISVRDTFLGWTEKFTGLFAGRKRLAAIGVFSFIGLLVLLFLAYWFVPRANIELTVSAQTLPKEAKITASTQFSEINKDRGEIPAEIVSARTSGSKKGVATGKKTVGDKAKGKVTIFNKTTAPRTFSSGTVITGPSSAKFILDENVTIASRSASVDGITYGKEDVPVTAEKLGSDYNLSSGKDFTVADFSADFYTARNNDPFTGGTSKEVTIISQKDIDQLKEALISDLKNSAKDELSKKLEGEQKLIDGGISSEIISSTQDKKVDEEASVVNLSMEVEFKGTVYKEKDLQEVLSSLVGQSIPANLELSQEKARTEISDPKVQDNGDLVFNAKLNLNLVPKYDLEEIKKSLAGRDLKTAGDYLTALPEFKSYKIGFSPPLPLQSLPKFPGNIKITVVSQ